MPCLKSTNGLGPGPFPDLIVFYIDGAEDRDDRKWIVVDIYDISVRPDRYVYPLNVPTPEWRRLRPSDLHVKGKRADYVYPGARILGKVPKGKKLSKARRISFDIHTFFLLL